MSWLIFASDLSNDFVEYQELMQIQMFINYCIQKMVRVIYVELSMSGIYDDEGYISLYLKITPCRKHLYLKPI